MSPGLAHRAAAPRRKPPRSPPGRPSLAGIWSWVSLGSEGRCQPDPGALLLQSGLRGAHSGKAPVPAQRPPVPLLLRGLFTPDLLLPPFSQGRGPGTLSFFPPTRHVLLLKPLWSRPRLLPAQPCPMAQDGTVPVSPAPRGMAAPYLRPWTPDLSARCRSQLHQSWLCRCPCLSFLTRRVGSSVPPLRARARAYEIYSGCSSKRPPAPASAGCTLPRMVLAATCPWPLSAPDLPLPCHAALPPAVPISYGPRCPLLLPHGFLPTPTPSTSDLF